MLSYRSCTLCPRRCGVDREAGELGFCRMPGQLRAARAMLHYGEEPPICANYGTGAVFFSGCTLRCRYCQNGVISAGGAGEALSRFAERYGVPFAETQAGKGTVVSSHPLNVGGVGETGCLAANLLAKEADLVILTQ